MRTVYNVPIDCMDCHKPMDVPFDVLLDAEQERRDTDGIRFDFVCINCEHHYQC